MGEKAADVSSPVPKKSDENEADEVFTRVCELLSPIREYWSLIQDILLWKKLEISVGVFNILNASFWIFLTTRLRILVSVAVIMSLLWLIPSFRTWVMSSMQGEKTQKKHSQDGNVTTVDHDEACVMLSEEDYVSRCERRAISYENLCHAITVIWCFIAQYWAKLQHLKERNVQKFYGLVVLLIVLLAIMYKHLPIGNILYLTAMLLYLWPALKYYGIKDNVTGKLHRLFLPFFTQWQSSRTKRKRATILQDHHKYLDDSEDEDFNLDSFKTQAIPSSFVSPQSEHEGTCLEPSAGLHDSINSSLTFTDGLEFPSIRRNSAESYNSDDFAEGLNFGNVTLANASHHSSMDSLAVDKNEHVHSQDFSEQATLNKRNVPQHPVQELTFEPNVENTGNESCAPLSRNDSSDDLQSYEVVDTSEIENYSNKSDDELNSSASYIRLGVKYMRNFFPYRK